MKNTIAILAVLTSLLVCLFIGSVLGSPAIGLLLFALDIAAVFIQPFRKFTLYSACGVASAAILFDCVNPLTGGTVSTMYVTNRDDIASVTKNGSNALIIEAITMVATKKFFKLEGRQDGTSGSTVAASYKSVRQTFGKAWEHLIDAMAFKADPATKKELTQWNLADIVAIVENKYRGATGNAAYEVYGLDGGLQIEELERNPNDKDTQGAWKIKFKTHESSMEGNPPYSLFITDYATTKAVVAALIA